MAHTLANSLPEDSKIRNSMGIRSVQCLSIAYPELRGCLMRKKIPGTILFLIIVSLCAWSPWITQGTASRLAEAQFNKAWSGVIDGCGTSANDLGAKDFQKTPFGARVTLDYQCGLVMPDEPSLQTNIYVSFFGIAFGYPKP